MYNLYETNRQEFEEELKYEIKVSSYKRYSSFIKIIGLIDELNFEEDKYLTSLQKHFEEIVKNELKKTYSKVIIW